jgi:acyl-CoA hydrolase
MSEEKKVQLAYTVGINLDGSIFTEPVPASENVQRQATTFDIYQTSKELVSDIEAQLLADRVAKLVVANMQPKDAASEIKAKIIDALSDRGIDTPQA